MKVADKIIADSNRDLCVLLESSKKKKKKTDRNTVKTAQTKIELVLGQKRQLEECLNGLMMHLNYILVNTM